MSNITSRLVQGVNRRRIPSITYLCFIFKLCIQQLLGFLIHYIFYKINSILDNSSNGRLAQNQLADQIMNGSTQVHYQQVIPVGAQRDPRVLQVVFNLRSTLPAYSEMSFVTMITIAIRIPSTTVVRKQAKFFN